MELWEEINQTQNQLDQCLMTLRKNGEAYAKAKQEYGIALRQEILKLRADGFPTTITPDLARGEEHVAELRLKRDIAESVWKANSEALNVKKIELNILKSVYEKEFNNVR